MHKKYLAISLIAVVGSAACLIALGALPFASIEVHKTLEVQLDRIPPIFLDVRAVNTQDVIHSSEDVFLESAINDLLRDSRVRWTSNEQDALTVIRCRYRSGWCLPYFGRHFDHVNWSSPNWIDIAVIDQKSGSVRGEVQYRRPLVAKRPPRDLLTRMWTAMHPQEGNEQNENARPEPPK